MLCVGRGREGLSAVCRKREGGLECCVYLFEELRRELAEAWVLACLLEGNRESVEQHDGLLVLGVDEIPLVVDECKGLSLIKGGEGLTVKR